MINIQGTSENDDRCSAYEIVAARQHGIALELAPSRRTISRRLVHRSAEIDQHPCCRVFDFLQPSREVNTTQHATRAPRERHESAAILVPSTPSL